MIAIPQVDVPRYPRHLWLAEAELPTEAGKAGFKSTPC